MASALEKVMKSTLQKSDAQKAFSPWWEDLEDKLLYSLMIMGLTILKQMLRQLKIYWLLYSGMITLPFNMVSNTPVECTLDKNHPSYQNVTSDALAAVGKKRNTQFWVQITNPFNFSHGIITSTCENTAPWTSYTTLWYSCPSYSYWLRYRWLLSVKCARGNRIIQHSCVFYPYSAFGPLRYYRVNKKIEAFYKLLVKDSLDREDVEAMEKDNAKNAHEVL